MIPKTPKCRKPKPSDVGRWVTVRWDDVGREDALLLSVQDGWCTVYCPQSHDTNSPEISQITEIRDFVVPA